MTVPISFTVTLSPQLARNLAAAGQMAGGPLRRYFQAVGEAVTKAYVKESPEDEGGIKRSFQTEIDPAPVPSWVQVGNASPHAPFVFGGEDTNYQWGRRPGQPMPPPEALEGWASRHGFSTEPGALFVLARHLGEVGIPAHPSWPVPFEHVTPTLEGGLLRQLAADLETAWSR